MVKQVEFSLDTKPRGFHIITNEVLSHLGELPQTGLLHLFIKHTSAGLAINENDDSTVLEDFEAIFNKLVPENMSFLKHTIEGPDDMPAHIKAVFTGHNITIPITNGKFNFGVWQGIYMCEFRNSGGSRKFVASIIS